MKPGDYLSDRLYQILLHLGAMLALAIFLLATGTGGGVVLIVLITWALGLLALLGFGYARANARLRELQALLDSLDKKYLFAECAPPPSSRYERQLMGMLRRSGKAMIEAVSNAEAAQRDYREYVENWVHEIKAPITAAQLMCRNEAPPSAGPGAPPSSLAGRLTPQLAQIDEHVERALYFARAGAVERDFAITETALDEVVGQALARHKGLLIQSGVRVETEGLGEKVYTDGKWVAFIVGQLLANAARYHGGEPLVRITARRLGRLVQLTVWDNGIGIPAHDLPRVFDKGFTGQSGRRRSGAARSQSGSTGMGLYIAKKLAGHLQIELAAESAEGEYTAVTLLFPARERAGGNLS